MIFFVKKKSKSRKITKYFTYHKLFVGILIEEMTTNIQKNKEKMLKKTEKMLRKTEINEFFNKHLGYKNKKK